MDATVEAVKTSETMKEVAVSDKSRLVALLLCFFFGWAGGHRFYSGKTGTALIMLFSMGGFGLWWFLDLVMIATGNFRDKNEHTISQWTK
jgi:TM2 domain-containing membrane protein YozV